MGLEFSAEIWHWAGPSPFYFVTVPEAECLVLKSTSKLVTYGWGMIPVKAKIGQTEFKTSLFPKEGRYVVPLKDSVRSAEGLVEGQRIGVWLEVSPRGRRK